MTRSRDSESPPTVKSFSGLGAAGLGLLLFYSGWFYSNLLENASRGLALDGANNVWVSLVHFLAWLCFGSGILGTIICFYYTRQKAWLPMRGSKAVAQVLVLVLNMIVLLAAHVKICAFELFRVRGHSMQPTLREGRFVWVNKLTTGFVLPELSFPFGRIGKTGKIPAFGFESLQRGDIVAIRYPGADRNSQQLYIKRIIAIPGEQYEIKDGRVLVGGEALDEPYLADTGSTLPLPDEYQPPLFEVPEELDELSPEVRYSAMNGAENRGWVPPHCYFVLGDNRRQSRDSRTIGFIPGFFILGKVM